MWHPLSLLSLCDLCSVNTSCWQGLVIFGAIHPHGAKACLLQESEAMHHKGSQGLASNLESIGGAPRLPILPSLGPRAIPTQCYLASMMKWMAGAASPQPPAGQSWPSPPLEPPGASMVCKDAVRGAYSREKSEQRKRCKLKRQHPSTSPPAPGTCPAHALEQTSVP